MRAIISSLFLIWFILLSGCRPGGGMDTDGEEPAPVFMSDFAAERHRPQFHFSPPEKWMNDPNGMVYYAGEYHLFYQYYPDSTVWGPMHWGHAVSKDLVRWEHLPIALYPDSLGYIFSGSAVVDWNNTSGFGREGEPPLVAIFTHHDPKGEQAGRDDFQYQSLAYSTDRGRTWTMYDGNPVVPNPGIRDFRDPKVIWHDGSKQWIMVFAARDQVKLYGSPNLKDWRHLSDFGREWGSHGGVWECPDLFPMEVDGVEKWVLLLSINPGGPNGGSATQYFIGDFDGEAFTLDPSFAEKVSDERAVWLDYGRDNYAGVTWSDIPREDGRRIFLGWMSNWSYATVVPTENWRSAMTIPRSLHLYRAADGYRLRTKPVRELTALRRDTLPISQEQWRTSYVEEALEEHAPSQYELVLTLKLDGDAADVGIRLSNDLGQEFRIGYNAARRAYYSDRRRSGDLAFSDQYATALHTAPRQLDSDTLHLHLFIDRASCELFADEGATVMTDIFFPDKDFDRLELYANAGGFQVLESTLYPLASIWEKAPLANSQ